MNPGTLKMSIYHCRNRGGGAIVQLLFITQEFVNEFLWIFWGLGRLTSNRWCSIGANPDHCPDQGIFSLNFYHCVMAGEVTVRIMRDQLTWRRFAVSTLSVSSLVQNCILYWHMINLQCSNTVGWATGRPKQPGVDLLVMTFWLELCTSYSSGCWFCYHHLHHP